MGGKRSSTTTGCFLGCFVSTAGRRSNHSTTVDADDQISSTPDQIISPPANPSVKRFSWAEIEQMTANFSKVIGIGGFSTIYSARFPGSASSSLGAVKVYNYSERLNQVFRSELEICGQLHHPNIVKLLGYCDERDEGVLVFEYIRHGNLQDLLHGKTNVDPPTAMLSWETRMAIAYQLAQALDHLHEQCSPHVVHGDIKASNILLEGHRKHPAAAAEQILNCKLCDFGFAKKGFSSTIRPNSSSSRSSSSSPRIAMMGSPGYVDPHYLMTGIQSKKSDVYSFGVIILELITGMEAYCSEREQLLTSMVIRRSNSVSRDHHFDTNKVVEMVDPRLQGRVDVEEVEAMAYISAMCLHHLPSLRPTAAEICRGMREKISSILCFSNPGNDLCRVWPAS